MAGLKESFCFLVGNGKEDTPRILRISSVWVAVLTWSNFNSENAPEVAVSYVNGESERGSERLVE